MATSKNEARTHLREQAFISEDILKSQQPCMIKDNLNILNQHIASLNSTEIKNHLKGLKAILEMLLVQVPSLKGSSVRQSYMPFDEAFGLFMSYSPNAVNESSNARYQRKRFKELLCHS